MMRFTRPRNGLLAGFNILRARQRAVTALAGEGDAGDWLIPKRLKTGGAPPPMNFDAVVTIGQYGGADNGYWEGLYGSIVPSPYVFGGFQLKAVYGTASTVSNCVTVGGGGGSLATRLEMGWSGGDDVVFIYEDTNSWSTSSKPWGDYVRAHVGGIVGVTIAAVPGGNFASTVYDMVVGGDATYVGYASGGGYGWNVPGMPLFDTSGIGQFRCRKSDGRTDLSIWGAMTGVYNVSVVVDALAPISFSRVTTTGWQAAGQTVLRDYLLSKIGAPVSVTITKV